MSLEYATGTAPGWAGLEQKVAEKVQQLTQDGYSAELTIEAGNSGNMELHEQIEARLKALKVSETPYELMHNANGDEVFYVKQ